jgi:hypothetical protein
MQMEEQPELINYPFAEDLAAEERINQMLRDAGRPPLGAEHYRMRTVEELVMPLTDPESFRQLVEEEASIPELREAWLRI